jgi:hypothetical protein
MMRALARAALRLYPRAWRERYGEEVTDLVASRPARLRTVLDLLAGAADAWMHHRPAARRAPRIPFSAVLTLAGAALLLLWNPGLRDPASLSGAWAEAAGAGPIAERLRETATMLFAVAAAQGMLSAVPLLLGSRTVLSTPGHSPLTRMAARRVSVTALLLGLPVVLFGAAFHGTAFADLGFPMGPLGQAMTGGFIVPIILALVLPLPVIAATAPHPAPGLPGGGTALAVAALLNALAWLPVLALLALGLPGASSTFVATVVAGALVSVWMSALIGRRALTHGANRGALA